MDEDNKSKVIKQPSTKDEEVCAKEAIESCPVEAISEEK
jgi:ferredoxin